MATEESSHVTMRVRVGDHELEVTGPVEFVEKKIAEFVGEHKQLPPDARANDAQLQEAGPIVSNSHKKATSPAQFFKNASPKTDVDRALVAGYYLERFEQLESFTAAEIRDTIRKAKIAPPKNPSDAVAKNIKKGLMMTAGDKDGKMAYVLTTDGEEAVAQYTTG